MCYNKHMKMILNGEERELFIEYKKKKHTNLVISPEGFITIRAPKGTSESEIRKMIEPLVPKIEKKLIEIQKNKEIYQEGSFNSEDKFKLFGEYKTFDEFGLDKNNPDDLKKFYTNELKTKLDEILKFYSKDMRVKYKGFKITETKTTWGTCNTDKNLTFNLRLAMAPIESVEYVVVHELAHLKHMNHDKSFWTFVGKTLPDYKERQKYLKTYGQFMQI